jgi:hypothetical protein
MKCSHPMCNRGIGLVSHRRSFRKEFYCSRRCRDDYAAVQPVSPADAALFAWLFAPANADARLRPVPATVRMRAR